MKTIEVDPGVPGNRDEFPFPLPNQYSPELDSPLCSVQARRILPHMGYIGTCGPKGYGFSAVLIIIKLSILAILVINKVWFLHSSLNLGVFLKRSYFFKINVTLLEFYIEAP